MAGAFLVAMNAHFHTGDDDKDWNTVIEIRLFKSDHVCVAERKGITGPFENASSQDFDVPMVPGTLMAVAEVPGSYSNLKIRPVGNDTWRFDYRLTLRFSDGSTTQRDFNGQVLDQDSSDGNYPL